MENTKNPENDKTTTSSKDNLFQSENPRPIYS